MWQCAGCGEKAAGLPSAVSVAVVGPELADVSEMARADCQAQTWWALSAETHSQYIPSINFTSYTHKMNRK